MCMTSGYVNLWKCPLFCTTLVERKYEHGKVTNYVDTCVMNIREEDT